MIRGVGAFVPLPWAARQHGIFGHGAQSARPATGAARMPACCDRWRRPVACVSARGSRLERTIQEERTIQDAICALHREAERMQRVSSATDTGADEATAGPPRPDRTPSSRDGVDRTAVVAGAGRRSAARWSRSPPCCAGQPDLAGRHGRRRRRPASSRRRHGRRHPPCLRRRVPLLRRRRRRRVRLRRRPQARPVLRRRHEPGRAVPQREPGRGRAAVRAGARPGHRPHERHRRLPDRRRRRRH